MELPSAVLLVVLVALGVMIVIVLEHRLSRIRRRSQTSTQDAVEPRPDDDADSDQVPAGPPAAAEAAHVLAAGPLAAIAAIAATPAEDVPLATSHDPLVFDRLSHVLMQGDTELATLTTSLLDPPWLDCTFEPTPAFSELQPLFDRELELLEHADGTFDQAAFVEQWQRIFAAGLWIRADPEGHHVSQFLLHVHPDGTARLRYG